MMTVVTFLCLCTCVNSLSLSNAILSLCPYLTAFRAKLNHRRMKLRRAGGGRKDVGGGRSRSRLRRRRQRPSALRRAGESGAARAATGRCYWKSGGGGRRKRRHQQQKQQQRGQMWQMFALSRGAMYVAVKSFGALSLSSLVCVCVLPSPLKPCT